MNDNDTRTARERAEELAAELFPSLRSPGNMMRRASFVEGFTRRDAEPTTVSAEQIELGAGGLFLHEVKPRVTAWENVKPALAESYRRSARATFRAAGFRIEGDEA